MAELETLKAEGRLRVVGQQESLRTFFADVFAYIYIYINVYMYL